MPDAVAEFIDVGKKSEALDILCDVLRSRKHRTWQKNHEDIMMKYLELCVELRRSYMAKEGIYQYRIICQQTQIKSFEDVVRKYLELAEGRAEAARGVAQAAVVEVDDLDQLQTPENILLSAVSSEVSQDRTDRVVLLPWVKFLWESYRQCLDVLRNYSRTESLYHDIALKAFQFCIRFNRKTEFRKLCDNLHTHLDNLKKQQQFSVLPTHASQNQVNLSNPETQAMHLETRLQQLDCAITMELWQEAYKATDDIKRFNLMNLSKKPLKPQLMASYYQKLALVFQKANCPIFHAAALLRHFLLTKELRKNIKEEELQRMASKVVAATLSMPIPPTRPEIDKLVDTEENVIENHHRNLASLLGLATVVPNRSSLTRDLKRMGVLSFACPELQQLFSHLEVEFDPLNLCRKVENVVAFMEKSEDLKQYVFSLKEVTVVRLLKEICQVYSSIEFKRLLQLCPYVDPISLENIIVNAARRNDIQIRIDHRKQCLNFGGVFMSPAEEIIEGPFLQSMPSSQVRQQLVSVYSVLQKARCLIDKDRIKHQRDQIKHSVMLAYDKNKFEEHHNILLRQEMIEERKEELEKLGQKREEQERKLLEEQQNKLRKEEQERMMREAVEREDLQKVREAEELKRRMAKDAVDTLRQTEAGQKILETLDESELYDLKVDEIRLKQYEQLEKERKEQVSKQQKLEKKTDHFERAKRLEEIPLLEAQYEKQKIVEREIFEKIEKQRIEELIAQRSLALEHRDRMLRMKPEADSFAQLINQARYQEYKNKWDDWKVRIEREKKKQLRERAEKRKQDRRIAHMREKAAKEEARKKEEQRQLFEAEKKRKEEHNAKMDEQAAKQRQRLAEIEARQEREKESMYDQRPPPATRAEPELWRGTAPAAGQETGRGTIVRSDDMERPRLREADQEDNWRGRKADAGPPALSQDKYRAPQSRVAEHPAARPDDGHVPYRAPVVRPREDQRYDERDPRSLRNEDYREQETGGSWRRGGNAPPQAPRNEERIMERGMERRGDDRAPERPRNDQREEPDSWRRKGDTGADSRGFAGDRGPTNRPSGNFPPRDNRDFGNRDFGNRAADRPPVRQDERRTGEDNWRSDNRPQAPRPVLQRPAPKPNGELLSP